VTAIESSKSSDLSEAKQPPRAGRSVSAWLAVGVIAVTAVAAGRYLIDKRHETATKLTLESAVLGAQSVPVGPADAAIVASVQVAAGDVVHAGQALARVNYAASAASDANSGVLTAPVNGVVISVQGPAGSVVKAGEAVVTMYASASLTFVASTAVDVAKKLRTGMSVVVNGPGLPAPIAASVGSAQANLSGNSPNHVNIALIPARISDVRNLVPGLAFQADVALTMYPEGAPFVLSGGR
jgi:multidrug resistance efflux pump